ncbi:hypothetical protein PRUB_a1729 [Pseudoalteromonas rubra]|uniref:Uncharacterized protein n=1 Tax=Pseudoalteromonas rubra TaxID=43658 RepID=A0A8T0CDB3_9GAMM|nr:hypothetical protein PRUB_a1729 [Pseudoalteromonas rubra]
MKPDLKAKRMVREKRQYEKHPKVGDFIGVFKSNNLIGLDLFGKQKSAHS